MCKFFSFVTVENNRYYFNWQQRQELLKNNPDDLEPDSHSSICAFHRLDEDKVNKFEYNPLTGEFAVDQINDKNNQITSKKWVTKLDFMKVCEPLIIKPIIHPFSLPAPVITKRHKKLLNQWDSVRASVKASVGASVWDSVSDSVRGSVWDSVWDSVRDSIWGSVSDSVWASVWDSVCGYASSFFSIEKWQGISVYPFQCCVDLWERGLVPSYDGTIWRLHSGKNAEKVWSGEIGEDK